MYKITELQRVADEENWRVVPHHVPVTFFGVELQSEPARIAFCVRRTFLTSDRREPDKRRRFLAYGTEQLRRRVLGDFGAGAHKMPVGTGALGVHDAFRNPFAIEVSHLFEQQKIFEDHRAARPDRERILVVAHRTSRICGHNFVLVIRHDSSSVRMAAA